MPLDAAIGRVFVPFCPGRRHGHRFWCKKLSCGIVKSLFEASVKMAQDRPSTRGWIDKILRKNISPKIKCKVWIL
jgi:hypothetical protein